MMYKANEILERLFREGKRIFTTDDIKPIAEQLGLTPVQLRKIISGLLKQKKITLIRRGVYIAKGQMPGDDAIHPFVISSVLVKPSVISHWSALQYHGLTEQVPRMITASTMKKVVTPSMRQKNEKSAEKKHVIEIEGVEYEYVTIKQQYWFGHQKIWLDQYHSVLITDKERTLIDLFAYMKMFGGIGEAAGMLETALSVIDIEKLVRYAIQYEQIALAKRLGWFLSELGVKQKTIKPLKLITANSFSLLDPSGSEAGEYDKAWMIRNNLRS